jgi:hypothetical protein
MAATRIDEIDAEYANLRKTPGKLLLSKLRGSEKFLKDLESLTDRQVIAYCYRKYHGKSEIEEGWLEEAAAAYLRSGELPNEVLHWLLPREFQYR